MAGPSTLRAALPGLRRTVRRFAPHLRRERLLVGGGLAALFAEVGLRLLEPWPLKFIIDAVIVDDPTANVPGLGWAENLDAGVLLAVLAGAIVVLTGLRALAAYGSTVAFALAGNRVLTTVRGELFRHLQRLSLRFHAGARTGDLLTRLTSDIGRLQEVTVTAALPLLGHVVTFVGMVAVMAWVDWRLTAIALAAFPVFALSMIQLTGRIRTVARTQRRVEGALASQASESLGAITVVQSYALEGTLSDQFEANNARSLKDGVKGKRLSAALERRTDVVVALGTGLVLYFGGRAVLRGALTPGDLVLFITYLKNAFKPLRDVAKYTGRLAKAAASGERIVDVLDTDPDVCDTPDAVDAPPLSGAVRFEHVTYGYDPQRPVLDDVDLDVRAGERIALVGPSGAGKSSLVGLLPRLYDPDAGRVLVDGVGVRGYTIASLRAQVGIVLQESVLFATTIRENIGYGAAGASDEEIEAAARLANAHQFITALPDGYDTIVGERGATLSGGQRQRIAIARAAVRRASIVVLDEPTAGLDGESERVVTEALNNLTRGCTTFLIAHDLRTVADADRILYLDAGKLVEAGTHAELVAAGGRYAAARSGAGADTPVVPAPRKKSARARAG